MLGPRRRSIVWNAFGVGTITRAPEFCNQIAAADSKLRHYRQTDKTCRPRGMPDALRCLLIVAGFGVEDVRHEALRIAVVEREERRLYLHHDAMSALDGVVHHR